MEETRTVARPYAQAAFEQAQAEGTVSEWSAMLEFLGAVVGDRQMSALIADPRVTEAQLTELVLDLCSEHLSETRKNFIKLLVENDRLSLSPAISGLFERERARSEGRAKVEVISAFEVDAKHRQMLTGAMAKRLGREVELSVRVDKDLIGGVVIRAGDVVIDGSLRGRLRQLESELL